jgi:ribosome modulation factor
MDDLHFKPEIYCAQIAYSGGYNTGIKGLGALENPYIIDSSQFSDWEMGWKDAIQGKPHFYGYKFYL